MEFYCLNVDSFASFILASRSKGALNNFYSQFNMYSCDLFVIIFYIVFML